MKNQWYDIIDLELFVESTRVLVYSSFGNKDNSQEPKIILDIKDLSKEEAIELNSCLSQQESMSICKEFLKNKSNSYRISDKKYYGFIEALNARMVSNMLNKLTQQGLLESAFDEESNDFIFWVKDEDEKK